MLRLFNRKQTNNRNIPYRDKMASKIVAGFLWLQRKWAMLMSRYMERLSPRRKKRALIGCAVIASVYSFYVIMEAIVFPPVHTFTITSIKEPAYVTRTGDEKSPASFFIPDKEYRAIHRFHFYIDSLNGSAKGKHIADSLLSLRPRLLDSIIQLEKFYDLQQQKK